jgi:hypothetical protein
VALFPSIPEKDIPMRVLSSFEVSVVSGSGVTVAPVTNINLNLNFFLSLFSIFKKKSVHVMTPPPVETPPVETPV